MKREPLFKRIRIHTGMAFAFLAYIFLIIAELISGEKIID
jgi:hypothetical protein